MNRTTKMKQATARSGKPWSGADIMRLAAMAEHQIPAERIAKKLRRTEGAVRAEAARQHILLAPSDRQRQLGVTDKRPYGGVSASGATARARSRATRPTASAPARARSKRAATPAQTETLF